MAKRGSATLAAATKKLRGASAGAKQGDGGGSAPKALRGSAAQAEEGSHGDTSTFSPSQRAEDSPSLSPPNGWGSDFATLLDNTHADPLQALAAGSGTLCALAASSGTQEQSDQAGGTATAMETNEASVPAGSAGDPPGPQVSEPSLPGFDLMEAASQAGATDCQSLGRCQFCKNPVLSTSQYNQNTTAGGVTYYRHKECVRGVNMMAWVARQEGGELKGMLEAQPMEEKMKFWLSHPGLRNDTLATKLRGYYEEKLNSGQVAKWLYRGIPSDLKTLKAKYLPDRQEQYDRIVANGYFTCPKSGAQLYEDPTYELSREATVEKAKLRVREAVQEHTVKPKKKAKGAKAQLTDKSFGAELDGGNKEDGQGGGGAQPRRGKGLGKAKRAVGDQPPQKPLTEAMAAKIQKVLDPMSEAKQNATVEVNLWEEHAIQDQPGFDIFFEDMVYALEQLKIEWEVATKQKEQKEAFPPGAKPREIFALWSETTDKCTKAMDTCTQMRITWMKKKKISASAA